MATRLVESVVRTNKLWCSDCGDKIKKGDSVIFELRERDRSMKKVFCKGCRENYEDDLIMDEEHPFSGDALGQD